MQQVSLTLQGSCVQIMKANCVAPNVMANEQHRRVTQLGFFSADLDLILRTKGVKYLILTGVTTDVCVSTTLREANDRG